jgi:DNA-binding transcriptional LysR family regulator
LELRHLRYFVAVAEELHFGRAAERLSMAQPPLSRQIRQLEEELGFRLFDRTKTYVRLTASGRTFLEDARRILAEVQESVIRARATDSGRLAELRIGNVGTPHASVLSAVAEFAQSRPEVHLTLTELTMERLLSAISDGRIDVGCFRQWMIQAPPEAVRVGETNLSAALPRGHKLLVRGKTIQLRALASTPFVSLARSHAPGYHERLIEACAQAGFVPKIVQEVATLTSMLYFVATGAGVAIVPNVELQHPKVAYRTVTGPEICVPTVALRTNRSDSAVIDAFLTLLTRAP